MWNPKFVFHFSSIFYFTHICFMLFFSKIQMRFVPLQTQYQLCLADKWRGGESESSRPSFVVVFWKRQPMSQCDNSSIYIYQEYWRWYDAVEKVHWTNTTQKQFFLKDAGIHAMHAPCLFYGTKMHLFVLTVSKNTPFKENAFNLYMETLIIAILYIGCELFP